MPRQHGTANALEGDAGKPFCPTSQAPLIGGGTCSKRACGMTKTVDADQKVPSCCGKEMQKTEASKPGESKGKGSCCSG